MLCAMVAKSGPCRLCPFVGELRNSHIVPAWSFQRIVANIPADVRVLHVTAAATISMHRQPREHLLCDDCEERVGICDNYASQVLAQPDGTFPWLAVCRPFARREDLEVLDSSGIDTDKLCRFAASVIWRASVSRTEVPKLSLGPYEALFRQYLRGETAFPHAAVLAVQLQRPPATDLPPADRIATLPVQKRHNGYSCHNFALCGAAFYLFVGGRIPEALKPHCLARTQRVYAVPSDRLIRELGEMIVTSPAKGAVARRLSREA
jgi:hypothetical protein